MKSLRLTIRLKLILFFYSIDSIWTSSFQYDQGLKLEKEKRWAEAAIEYRMAAIEDPENEEIIEALKRMNLKVAAENFENLQGVFKGKGISQSISQVRKRNISLIPTTVMLAPEMSHRWHLLITGKVELEFSRFGSNLRLAEEMEMQVLINSTKR